MFSLNRNGKFVSTMFKKSYFLKWSSPPQMAFTAVPLKSPFDSSIFKALYLKSTLFLQ